MISKVYPVTIEIIEDCKNGRDTITLPAQICSWLKEASDTRLKVGADTVSVKYAPNSTEELLEIPKQLADDLALYSGLRTQMLLKDNCLCLGPVIGTFTDSTSVRIASEQRAGKKLNYLRLANMDARTILYFFSVDDFFVESDKIYGTYYNNTTKCWEKRLFPIPDVLYDRGGGLLKRQIAPSEFVRQTIENNENVKKFNPRYFFDKWDTYNKLNRYEDLCEHLPLTVQYRSSQDLLEMLGKFPVLYIKDRKGNRGLGVARLTKHDDGSFTLDYFMKELFNYHLESFEALVDKLNELFKNKRAIIQYAIDVIKINNGNVDLRATVQRDGNGELGITACSVRVGKEGTPVTSTRSGSKVYRFEDFFPEFLSCSEAQTAELKSKVDEFLLKTYRYIEELYGTFGEIGIDFAIDNEGKIWFIECNAKPGKDTVYLSCDEKTVKDAFLKPLEYSKYLCGFNNPCTEQKKDEEETFKAQ